MRKLLMAALAASVLTPVALAPAMASAQSAREVRHDQREVRQGQREVRRDVRRGDYREAREDRREVREDRRELHEDWQDYRQSHRNVYRQSAYVGPRGYSYRPVNVGYRFAPTYYSGRYQVTDHQRYRLPRPGANQRWVRYGNDVVLVNVRNGRVVQVHNRFFW